jgi:Alkylmercury lyase
MISAYVLAGELAVAQGQYGQAFGQYEALLRSYIAAPEAQAFDTSAANLIAKFCHFIFFFSSRQSGERWVAKHPATFLYSLDDAFALAKRFNARNFGPELARRASSRPPTN